MNKRGFTLVELLGVIVILGVIIILVSTNGFGLLNKAEGEINKVEEENLFEAARVFLVDIDNGNVTVPDYKLCASNITTPCVFKNGNVYRCNVAYLKENGYFKDEGEHCDEKKQLTLEIKKDDDGNTISYNVYKVNNGDVICTK